MNAQPQEKFSEWPHVLVVDDDKRILELVSRYLLQKNFITVMAENAQEARMFMEAFEFDVVVADIMMPGETGLELTEFLREHYPELPVILLTALGEVDDRLAGFDAGADDYLAKPFEPQELLMRLQAILRRTQKKKKDLDSSFKIGNWTFDERMKVIIDGHIEQSLTELEVKLIKALARADGEVTSREALALACDLEGSERSIDVQITRLRKKIEKDTKAPLYLQTVRGKGYLLRIEPLS